MCWSHDGTLDKGPQAPLRRRCASCMATHGDLRLCTGCRLVRYCGAEHQVQHRPQHKRLCKKAARLRDKAQHEEHHVRHAVPDLLTPANAFETHAGRFGDLLNTRDYMLARFHIAFHAACCGTLDGVAEALDHFRDMIRLDPSDILGVREFMPALMLRLDLDQECYDFVKCWETCAADRHYNWADMGQALLRGKDADALEEPVFLLTKWTSLSFQSAVLLLKLKLLVDIRNLKVARQVASHRLPVELLALVEKDVIRSPLSARFTGHVDLEGIEDILINQCYYLGVHMGQSNRYFMAALLNPPQERPSIRGDPCPKGSPGEALMALQTGYYHWWETLGTLDLLQEASARANIDWQAKFGHASKLHPPGWPAQTAQDPFDFSQMWEHLDCVIKESSYLGPAKGTRGRVVVRLMEDDVRTLLDDNLAEE